MQGMIPELHMAPQTDSYSQKNLLTKLSRLHSHILKE